MVFLGLIVNPVAGLGGRVGLKGTDGVVEEAVRRGAEPLAPGRATASLRRFMSILPDPAGPVSWCCAGGAMGEAELKEAGIDGFEVVHRPPAASTSSLDTVAAATVMAGRGVSLILFAGGDGTARDILGGIGRAVPVLGIPAGVKMHSGVFAETPEAAGEVLANVVSGRAEWEDVDVMDLDEEAYRRGEWRVSLFGVARVPREPELMACGKIVSASNEEEDLQGIGEHVRELMLAEPDTLFILGPGSTVEAVAKHSGLAKTLLGIDAYRGMEPVATDADQSTLERLASGSKKTALVLSPVGGQGFVIGRGNAPISPAVVARAMPDGLVIVATPKKLVDLAGLRFDTGDPGLDRRIRERRFVDVVTDYRTRKLVRTL